MLDIIVTHYKEPFNVGKKMFDMIGLQRCIDFEQIRVVVIHDGTDPFPKEKFADYPYQVEQIAIPHGGVSNARNAGIDNCKAKWIMFCDFDDSFTSIYSLREILNVLNTDNYDMLWCKISAEDYVDGKKKSVFCTGKTAVCVLPREGLPR